MSKLKLKSNLPENFRVTKQIVGVGMFQFDSSKVDKVDYPKWSRLGFGDLFEEEVEVIEEAPKEVKEVVVEQPKKAPVKRKRNSK